MTVSGSQRKSTFGATGGRLDHLLANLYLPPDDFDYLKSDPALGPGQHSQLLPAGFLYITKEADKDYLAFVNLTPVTGLNLVDEQYPLADWSSSIRFPGPATALRRRRTT